MKRQGFVPFYDQAQCHSPTFEPWLTICGLLFPREDPWKQLTGLKQTGEGSDKCSERVFVPYVSTKYLGGFLRNLDLLHPRFITFGDGANRLYREILHDFHPIKLRDTGTHEEVRLHCKDEVASEVSHLYEISQRGLAVPVISKAILTDPLKTWHGSNILGRR